MVATNPYLAAALKLKILAEVLDRLKAAGADAAGTSVALEELIEAQKSWLRDAESDRSRMDVEFAAAEAFMAEEGITNTVLEHIARIAMTVDPYVVNSPGLRQRIYQPLLLAFMLHNRGVISIQSNVFQSFLGLFIGAERLDAAMLASAAL